MTESESARLRWEKLSRMTVANGCTVPEAAAFAAQAERLRARWGFGPPPPRPSTPSTPAAAEYRKCGKATCWCANAPKGGGHGPYRYKKRRKGAKVSSEYQGKATTWGGKS